MKLASISLLNRASAALGYVAYCWYWWTFFRDARRSL